MDIEEIPFTKSLVGNDGRFLVIVSIVAIIGAGLSRTLLQTRPVMPTGRTADMASFTLFILLFFLYFIISVNISFDGGGLLESVIVLGGVVFGFYSSVCVYIAPAWGRATLESSLQCSVVGTSFPVLGFPVLDIVVTSAVVAFALSIVSVGLGRLLHHQITTK